MPRVSGARPIKHRPFHPRRIHSLYPPRGLPQPRERSLAASPQTRDTNMGWLYRDEPIDDPLAYLKAKYNYDCDTHTLQTLDGARVRNTVFLAVRSTEKKTGRSFVFAAVILISNTKKSGFGYKDMSESMGPCEFACPLRIIRLLSPIADLPIPAIPPSGAHALPPSTMSGASGGSCRSRSSSAPLTLPAAIRFSGGIAASEFPRRLFPPANADFRSSRPAGISLPLAGGDAGCGHDYRARKVPSLTRKL